MQPSGQINDESLDLEDKSYEATGCDGFRAVGRRVAGKSARRAGDR